MEPRPQCGFTGIRCMTPRDQILRTLHQQPCLITVKDGAATVVPLRVVETKGAHS